MRARGTMTIAEQVSAIKWLRAKHVRLNECLDEIRPLRRQIVFYCHPDRGGDAILMRKLNAFFDALENS